MPRPTLAFKLVATGAVFLVIALASIALTLWVTWQLEGGAAAVNEAGRMRMMSYRLALSAHESAPAAPATLTAQAQAMDATLELLRVGDPSRPLFIPWSDEARAAFDAARERWPALRARWLAGEPVAGHEVDALVQPIDRFVSLIERRLSHWTEVLRAVQLTMAGLAVGSAVLLLYASHLLVLDPLRRLGEGLASIRRGHFATRVEVDTADEFGDLQAGFNAMAERLQALYSDLEARVDEKTERLREQRERLSALYEVSAFVAMAADLETLAQGFAVKVRRIAAADAVAVRWSDEANERYLMLAQDGLPPALASEEQCLSAGGCHCGQAVTEARTRVVPIVPADGARGACRRAGFEMLLTVPVALHQRVLGEIDLFYRRPRDIGADDRSLVETLASHLAGGMESLHAQAADKEAAVAGERRLLAQELHDSIAQSLAFLKIQVGLLRGALERGDHAAAERTVGEIDTGVRESYGDVRELLLHFRTRTSAEDIEPALRTTLQKFEHQTGLATRLEVQGHGVPLPPDVRVQVLHVLLEALSNVRKHAGATSVQLVVRQTPEWRFEVVDDGRGFDSAAVAGPSHVGLRIMRERAARIGAAVEVFSQPGQGTRVVLTVGPATRSKETSDEPAGAAAGGR